MSKFKDYVTNQAFSLALSKPMIDWLFWTESRAKEKGFEGFDIHSNWMSSEQACERRGLCKRVPDTTLIKDGTKPVLTEEGELVLNLLKCAGFGVEKCKVKEVSNA